MTVAPDGSARDQEAAAPPRCYRHPSRDALVRCTRCDRPICPECMREASVGFHCPEDVAIAKRTARRPRTSVGAMLRGSPPYVTAVLVGLNAVTYLATGLQSPASLTHPTDGPIDGLFSSWQLQPGAVYRDDAYWRLMTSAFLHINPLHLGANMLALVVIGPALERLLGRIRFLALYLLAALGGSAAIYVFGAAGVAVVGASGAIFGLFGASLALVRRLGLDLQWLIGIIVLNFVFTFSVPGISVLGHLGGFVTGALAALAIAGLPQLRRRVPTGVQAAGLSALLAALLLAISVRTVLGDF
ncbi:MAG: rhomboid family intramembrane serine protease [Actinomycetota bacterium]|nr:rhomboid family intramembrane serine protease [Actinomycetota bacterium]